MNVNEWTNAVKAGVTIAVTTTMDFILALAIFLGLEVDAKEFAGLTLALNAAVNGLLGLWILFTYKNSPLRVTEAVRRDLPLLAAEATAGATTRLAPPA